MDFNSLLSPLMRKVLVGVIGVAIFPLTHWLTSKGILNEGDSATFIAEIFALIISMGGAIWAATHQQKRENTANASMPQTSAELDTKLKEGEVAPVSVPKDVVPTVAKIGAIFLALALALATSCATVQSKPTTDSAAMTRQEAGKVYVAVEAGSKIINGAGKFVDSLPTNAGKNDLDCGIVKVMGTSKPRPELLKICGPDTPQGPGPMIKALEELKTVTSMPSLKATTARVIEVVEPLLKKLEASTDAAMKALGMSLRATLDVVFAFASGS